MTIVDGYWMNKKNIVGVVLAGGLGSRLSPVTDVVNKHLLPVAGRPMLFWPIEKLALANIREILVVVGGKSTSDIMKLLGDGHRFGVKLTYAYQETEGGIADALKLAQPFVGDRAMCVVLGDNWMEDNLGPFAHKFMESRFAGYRAMVLLKIVSDYQNYGCPVLSDTLEIKRIVEKPPRNKMMTGFAVTGFYFYTSGVFDALEQVIPSERGELEITDVNNIFARAGQLSHGVLKGEWVDMGASFAGYERASEVIRRCTVGSREN